MRTKVKGKLQPFFAGHYAFTEHIGPQVFRINLHHKAKREWMHDVFNTNNIRSYSAKMTLLDLVYLSGADPDPETAEEMAVEMCNAEPDDLNHTILT